MKRVLLLACFSLVTLAGTAAPAQAGGRFFVGFRFGYGVGYYRCYRPYSSYRYAFYPYAFDPYYSPFITYGYVPPPRIYPVAPFRAYTLYLPRYRVRVPLQREQGRSGQQKNYGQYVPRRYGRQP